MAHPAHPEPDCEVLSEHLAPGEGAAPSAPPPPPVRGARLLAWADGGFTRLDTLIERALPRAQNPLAQLGPATNAALLLATLSGVLLLIWYSPSVVTAWASLAELGPRSPGGLTRSIHRYSSDLAMLLLGLHALRTFFARKFSDARWLAWVSGVGLLGLVWFIGWTGYWLVWDVRAQTLALGSMKFLDALPIFGEPLGRLFTLDRTVPSLLFFVVFFLHMVVPLAIAGGLALHLARLSRSQLLPDRRLSAWLGGAVLAAALLWPATNAAPAAMAVKPAAFTMDWWYLWPVALTTRLSGPALWLVFGLATLGFAGVPWWLARRRPRAVFQAKVDVSRCFACTQCSKDCPFGAITMVPRTDGKPFPSQAQVDPDRCIGCSVCTGACDTQGVGVGWFDGQRVTRELEAFVTSALALGEKPALALVCAQNHGGWELFDEAAWQRRLPGYTVRPIPCAGWVEPKVLERVIAKGARAVLVVGCASGESYCREGNLFLAARLAGTREPEFRPNRADPRRVALVNFDPLRPHLVTAAAARLLERDYQPPAKVTEFWAAGLAAALLTIVLGAATLLPADLRFRNPAPEAPEFVFTFRTHGAWLDSAAAAPAAQDNRPVHMRSAQPVKRGRAPVRITLAVDGAVQEHVVAPKGLKSDGVSVGELRVPLAPGPHRVEVRVRGEREADWAGTVTAAPRRLHVLAYDGGQGFEWHP